jgi:PadR family transcriptional regulator AphA
METPLTTTSYALLGLLSVRAWTTYELAKQVQRSLRWFWPRAERKLYDEPKRLVAAGLATATTEQTGRRTRTVYTITAAGRRELRRWLGRPPAPPVSEFEGMVKVFFATAAGKAELMSTLGAIAAQAADRRAELRGMAAQSLAGTSPFPERRHLGALALRLHVDLEHLVEEWAVWAQEQVTSWPQPKDPGEWPADAVLADLARAEPRSPTQR